MALAAPTSSLPPLSRLSSCSFKQVSEAVENIRSIYCPSALSVLPKPKALPKHLVHDLSVPDSGYASAEGEDDSDDECDDSEPTLDPDILRADSFEREFAIRWLTGFTSRADMWAYASDCSETEMDARAALVDAAASILATFAGDNEEEALTRTFTFPTGRLSSSGNPEAIHVELNDAPLLSDDHTSVGLQSWGSSIRLAERMAVEPDAYGLGASPHGLPPRVLELGAGTGLLSIAAAKLLTLSASSTSTCKVVATDYHPSVLDNLHKNVDTNFPSSTSPVDVLPLDWSTPAYEGPLASPFDVILAADVIYHPEHARWIKTCAEHLLLRPTEQSSGGVFWLIIPLRPTGRHEGMSNTVDAVFPLASEVLRGEQEQLVVLMVEEIRKQDGVGRADEGGYKLYKIGWM